MNNVGKIIILFDTPPKVSKGAFNWLSQNWPSGVYYIFDQDFPDYRKSANWNDNDYGKAVLLLDNSQNLTIIEKLINDPDNVFIFAGFANKITKRYLDRVLRITHNVFIFSERPCKYGHLLKRFLQGLKWHFVGCYYCRKYQDKICAFLPLGQLGIREFKVFGWRSEKLYNFMYNPVSSPLAPDNKTNKPIRFAYVGRFAYNTKGVDVLMKAVKCLNRTDYHLEMIGGYGVKTDEIIKWIDANDHVSFGGTWDSLEVCNNLRAYDAIIIPSRSDGWNLLVNEGINAGIGIICSDQAVSHELIQQSGCGQVFPAGSAKDLAACMKAVLDSPSVLSEWRRNAAAYQPLISPERVGQYLMDIIQYEVYQKGGRPSCPWIVR